jgi:hypothetical protein
MSTSAIEIEVPTIEDVKVPAEAVIVELSNGRPISVPIG